MFILTETAKVIGSLVFLFCVSGVLYCIWDLSREEKKFAEGNLKKAPAQPVYMKKCLFIYPGADRKVVGTKG